MKRNGGFQFIIGFTAGAVIFGGTAAFAASGVTAYPSAAKVTVNGAELQSETYTINGVEYAPLYEMAGMLNAEVKIEAGTSQTPEVAEVAGIADTSDSGHTLYENELGVIELVNAERAKAGLQPVKLNTELCAVARVKAEEMVALNYFEHKSPVCGRPQDMIEGFGIDCKSAGECIAYQGGAVPAGAVYNWMHSEGHKNIILSPGFTDAGVGLAENGKGLGYWSLMFIN